MSMSYGHSEAGNYQRLSYPTGALVQSNRGHVIFPKALLDFSTDLRDVLGLIVIPGNLEWRGSKYKLLKEDDRLVYDQGPDALNQGIRHTVTSSLLTTSLFIPRQLEGATTKSGFKLQLVRRYYF
ncbi:MAG: hypothetical protein FRX48_00897 [Lasallia pustulata]|uniref:Uncharacterized protein n=1 Tax=Lasallia pustulata TaxID=136370 RepID=A0A5M8Q473_9LECA|nr:MAG: hypothetical protein FRX48_00897 [Lasallia pustulata]